MESGSLARCWPALDSVVSCQPLRPLTYALGRRSNETADGRGFRASLTVGVERRVGRLAQARQHAVQLLTLVSGQLSEEGVFGFAELLVSLGQPTLAGGRDRHDVTSSVVGVSLAFD